VAQTAPILNALGRRIPALRITVRSMAHLEHLRSRIDVPFEYVREGSDIGMLMSSPMDVNVKASAEAYASLHRDWGAKVRNESNTLREFEPDFVLSNVGYLPLAGANRAGIPCAAVSSLNWADIFSHYCGSISGTHQITTQMRVAYNNADAFIRLSPGMPMRELYRRQEIGPVAAAGKNRRDEINNILNLHPDEKLVLVSLGGIAGYLPMDTWPKLPGVRWLVPADWRSMHPDASVLESINLPFNDILASADVLICKPGYGSFVEAACNGIPVLYSNRADWPESTYLTQWLAQHGLCREVSRFALESGNFADALTDLLAQPKPQPVAPTGIVEAVDWLEKWIGN